jgi:adenylate cyclase
MVPCIDRYDGIMLKMEGDSLMILFRRPEKAISCAMAIQKAAKTYNINKPPTDHMLFCIGLGYGRMLRIGDDDVFGAEVNAASKLGEDIADAWEVLVTDQFKEAITDKRYTFEKIDRIPPGAKAAYRLIYTLE